MLFAKRLIKNQKREEERKDIYLPVWTAKSPLIVPGSAWRGLVAPISFRADATTPAPSHAFIQKKN